MTSDLKKLHEYATGKTEKYLPIYPLPANEICGFDIPFVEDLDGNRVYGLFIHLSPSYSEDGNFEIAIIAKIPYVTPIWLRFPTSLSRQKAQQLIDIAVALGAEPRKEKS